MDEITALRLNTVIMDTAVRGACDCFGWTNIYHRQEGRYLLVYLEDILTGREIFRIFRCGEGFRYERKLVLEPSYINDNYICLYDSFENRKGRTVLHSADGRWPDDIMDINRNDLP